MTLLESLARAVALVSDGGHRCALVGGLAVSTRSAPRFTRDADLAVAVADDTEAEALVRFFVGSGYSIEAQLEQEETGRLSGVRLLDQDGVSVDLLFASSGVESELVRAADTFDVAEGVTVPVATVGHLIALKLLSVDDARPTDRADLIVLGQIATTVDWSAAADAVGLIEARGFDRGRDLGRALQVLRSGSA